MVRDEWKPLSLRNLCELKYGKSPKETVLTESGFPIVGTSGVVGYSEKPLFQAPLIMVGRKGTIDKPLFIQDDCWIIDTAYGLLADNSAADIKWLFYFLSNYGLGKLNEATGVPSLSRDNLYNIEVLTPPLPEQRKIAAILTSVDDAITATQRIIDQTEVVKHGLMQQLLTRGIGHTTFKQTEIGEIPAEWDVIRLEEIATVERGKFSHRPRNDSKFYGGNIPFVQTGDVTKAIGYLESHSQTLNELGLSVSRSFPKGTILVTIAANIGETAIATYDVCFPDSLVGVIPNSVVNGEYLELALRMKKDVLDKDATRSAQKNINLQNLRPLLIPLPSFEEQKKIAGTIYGLESRIYYEKHYISRLLTLKQSLMQVLLTGKVRVHVDSPSEVLV